MTLDYSKANLILKNLYNDSEQRDMIAKSRPTLGLLGKEEKMSGDKRMVVPRYGMPETVNTVFSDAQTAASSESSKWARFEVTGITKHGVALIDGDIIARADNDLAAFIRPIKTEIDGVMETMSNRRAGELFGSGWGDIGTIKTGSISGATLVLNLKSSMVRVEKGQKHVFSQSQSSNTLRNTGGTTTLTVLSVNRSTQTVTYTANVSTVTGVTDGDYVFIYGDRQDSATPSRVCLAGFEGNRPRMEARCRLPARHRVDQCLRDEWCAEDA
jgi:hypothetical protein